MADLRQFVPAMLIAGSLIVPAHAVAQEATPPAGEATPAPRAMLAPCAAEPRNLDEVVAVWFSPEGTPVAPAEPIASLDALPEGERVDETTEAAITETTLGWIACLEFSGQPARGFSYMTDHFLTQFAPDPSNPEQDTAEEVRAALEAQMAGTPIPSEVLSPLLGPRRARVLEDGRIGAVWAVGGDRWFFIYTQADGQWLIDDAIDIVDPVGTPVAGTPAP